MRELSGWEWFAIAVALIAGLLYLVTRLHGRLPPNRTPRKHDDMDPLA